MRRAPAWPVRACFLRKRCPVSHVTFEAPLRTSHFSLHSSHSTLHTSHCTLRTPHFTSHCTLKTPHFTLHTSQSTLHTSHFSLLSSHSTLHTPHFTLHSSRPTLHTAFCTLPHVISSELFSPYPSSSLLICHPMKASTSQYYFENLHAPCASEARACVLCAKLLQCGCPGT